MKVKETELTQELTDEARAAAKAKAAARKKVIGYILKLRRQGSGYPAIAKILNDSGVPTFGAGRTWHPPVVRAICIRELGGAEESKQAREAALAAKEAA